MAKAAGGRMSRYGCARACDSPPNSGSDMRHLENRSVGSCYKNCNCYN